MAQKSQGKHGKHSTPSQTGGIPSVPAASPGATDGWAARATGGTPPAGGAGAPHITGGMPSVTGGMPPVGGAVRPAVAGGFTPSYQMSPIPPESQRHRGLKIFGITMGVILGALALVYFVGVIIFMGRFFPHTSIIDMDISGKTPEEVHEMLSDVLDNYTFRVEGHGLNLTLSAADMGMSLDSQSIADNLLAQMNPWAWPYEVFQSHDDTEDLKSTFEETKLASVIQAAVEEANAKGQPPKNATVAYDEEAKEYVVVPEVLGNTLLSDQVLKEVAEGTVNFAPKVTLSDAVLAQPTVTADDAALAQARDAANGYVKRTVQLMMAGQEALAIDENALASHITIAEDGTVAFDVEPLVTWVKEATDGLDTVGVTRTYTRPDGKVITVAGGDYGWITNSQATADAVREALTNGTGGPVDVVMKWSAGQLPDENGRDFGARYIDVDITEQYARFYGDDGSIIWESDLVSGRPSDGRDTPRGTYYLKTNDGASVLRGYKPDGTPDYESEVDYWMPFKGNSVGFHDAPWQPTFGGDWYIENGSHGCINLPPEKARELHEIIKVGDAVVVHD